MNESDSIETIQEKLENVVNPRCDACGCMGPQDGDPVCPCAMQFVIRYRGRWIKLEEIVPSQALVRRVINIFNS